MAKELLYKEIVENKEFKWKDKHNTVFTQKIEEWNEVRMEFPYFYDGVAVSTPYNLEHGDDGCEFCFMSCVPREDRWCNNQNKTTHVFECKTCELFTCYKGMKFFDIVISVLDGGGVYWIDSVIEIVNKHYPTWRQECLDKIEWVYIIKAEDILKRVSNTPVYVEDRFSMMNQYMKEQTIIQEKELEKFYPELFC